MLSLKNTGRFLLVQRYAKAWMRWSIVSIKCTCFPLPHVAFNNFNLTALRINAGFYAVSCRPISYTFGPRKHDGNIRLLVMVCYIITVSVQITCSSTLVKPVGERKLHF